MKAAVTLPRISTEKPPNCQNDAGTPSPIRCAEINECQDWKQKNLDIFYWSFRRGKSPDTWANDLGWNFSELLTQVFGSFFNKFLFLILILILI